MTHTFLCLFKNIFHTVFVCVPVLAVLDALTQRGPLSQRRVPTATRTSGQDTILNGQKENVMNVKMFNIEDRAKDNEESVRRQWVKK